MGVDIKKTGKNTYYRKDGNKLGKRKEKQEIINISLKYFEKDMSARFRGGAKTLSNWNRFNSLLSGGFKRGEMATIAACAAFPGDDFRSTLALAAIHNIKNNKTVIVGMEHDVDNADRLAEEFKNQMEFIPYYKPVHVNGVPYNPMDEFDRPDFYKEKSFITDMQGSFYLKNSEEVLSEQFKIDIHETQDTLVIEAINKMVNVNKPYKLVIDNEGKPLYPEIGWNTPEFDNINFRKFNTSDFDKPELDSVDLFKDKDFLDKYFEHNHFEHIQIDSLVKVIDNILEKDNQEVLVIDKEDDKTYFSKTGNRYKSVIVDKERLEIDPESAITTYSYITIQESLIRLLESIKGNEEFLVTYKHIDNIGVCGILSRKEWYMKKSKITLVIPEWMIEPKNVYRYMSATGISDEEKEDTLIKRLDKLLENTDYKWSLEEKMVPDSERTILYNTRLMCGVFVTCVNELDNKFYYTKLEALAEAYKAIYNFKKEGYLKFNKLDVDNLPELKEEIIPVTQKTYDNIGRGHSKPFVFTDISLEELIEMITLLLPEGSGYSLDKNSTTECVSYNVSFYTDKSKETTIIIPSAITQAEALSNFYTYLRLSKSDIHVQ